MLKIQTITEKKCGTKQGFSVQITFLPSPTISMLICTSRKLKSSFHNIDNKGDGENWLLWHYIISVIVVFKLSNVSTVSWIDICVDYQYRHYSNTPIISYVVGTHLQLTLFPFMTWNNMQSGWVLFEIVKSHHSKQVSKGEQSKERMP